MALQIIRNNIVNVEADAVVNTANPLVAIGVGVDHAIYEAAGRDKLLEARAEIGVMEPGQVAYTPAFDLNAKYIIHAIGPAWRGGGHGERKTVAKCYSGSLALARELECESIAFPLLATGTYGFPKDEALRIALNEISTFLLDNEMEVMLVVYDKESYEVSGKLFSEIKSFIDESDVVPAGRRNRRRRDVVGYGGGPRILNGGIAEELYMPGEEAEELYEEQLIEAAPQAILDKRTMEAFSEDDLRKRIEHMDKTFQEYLLMLIDRKGMTDPEVYKKANLDRKHFSKIRSNKDYKPSKRTAVALAVALELSLDETKDLLLRAGLAFSPSSIFDRIMEYYIGTEHYDIYEINSILFEYDQPTLGA